MKFIHNLHQSVMKTVNSLIRSQGSAAERLGAVYN